MALGAAWCEPPTTACQLPGQYAAQAGRQEATLDCVTLWGMRMPLGTDNCAVPCVVWCPRPVPWADHAKAPLPVRRADLRGYSIILP